ncbi:unnamed protein product [Pedinophyceae sp. YPF-701]|nr:unnamed protein product [Pedinophyceae sp. YPF-701]
MRPPSSGPPHYASRDVLGGAMDAEGEEMGPMPDDVDFDDFKKPLVHATMVTELRRCAQVSNDALLAKVHDRPKVDAMLENGKAQAHAQRNRAK